MEVNHRLKKLREKMVEKEIDAIIVPTSDPHQSEYLPDHYKVREYISGFTGSNGTAVVTKNKAYIWTDGRYFIQCQKEIKNSEFEMKKFATPGELTITEFLLSVLESGSKVELNLEYYSRNSYKQMKKALAEGGIEIVHGKSIEELWVEQPPIPKEKIFVLEEEFAGESRKKKIDRVREQYKRCGANSIFISSLEDIAWLLNIRGRDIPTNPVTISYLYLMDQGGVLFLHSSKMPDDIRDQLEEDGIHLLDYDRVFDEMKEISGKRICMDVSRNSQRIFQILKEKNEIIPEEEITSKLKSVKNKTELKNLKQAYIEDGVALTKFIYWLKNKKPEDEIGEFDAAEFLGEKRRERKYFLEESFDTISAYGSNAAMMHYSVKKENQSMIEEKGFLLVDSGGQYLLGTTDTTRTIVMGDLSENQKHDFTLVLKSSIALLNMKFLKGTRDSDLDAVARYPLWMEGKDYKCGTGHGVGYLLSVHESPPRFSFRNPNPNELKLGQMVTIEPGIYKEGEYGIRTENTVIVTPAMETEDGEFYAFDNLTRVPIDVEAIDVILLTESEIEYLNTYHEVVYRDLEPYLNDEEKIWLREVTQPVFN